MEEIDDIRICFVGDSFVNGTGDPEKLGWTGRLCALSETSTTEVTYYNLGIRRNTSDNIKSRWKLECEPRLPQDSQNIIVFSFGVNDTVIENHQPRVTFEQSLENAKTIFLDASKLYTIKVIGPPPINDNEQNFRIKKLDKALQALCHKISIPYLSIFQTLVENSLWHQEVASNDGAHPRTRGYAYLARLVKSWDDWDI